MPRDDLHRRGVVRLLRDLATGELRAARLADALIERSARLDPSLRAWAWFDAAHARREAARLDRDGPRGPLHGLPIAVKDNIDTAGVPTEHGSPIYAGHVPSADAGCVALARAAGAWLLGKTACTELANMSPGPTRNPHDTRHTPGGSSAGSAAAVAAGLAPVALGTQTAGSVIRPAAFCGVVGYKPSPPFRIPRTGVKLNSDTLDEVGVFAASIDDAALVALLLAGRAPSLPGERAFAPRLGVTLTSRAALASADTAALIESSARRLAAAGAAVRDAGWPAGFDALFDAHRTVQAFETARALDAEWRYRRELLSPALAAFIAEGHGVAPTAYREALALAAEARAAPLRALFDGLDAVIAPAAAGAAPRGLGGTGDPLFCRPWQILGCACVALPAGRDAAGLRLGLQLVGPPGDDQRLLAAAAWIEAALSQR